MADRFPSLDDFDAGQTEAKGDAPFDLLDGPDSSADFLARERAALGDDANQFASVEDGSPDDDDDLLGGGGANRGGGGGQEMAGFEDSFPAIETGNEQMAPGGTITGTGALPYLPTVNQSSQQQPPASSYADDTEEPEPIRAWRSRRDAALAHRDRISAERKDETVKAAQAAIDDFYTNYNNKKEKSIAQTRREADEFLENRDDTTAGGTSWERIARLVDLSGKGGGAGKGGQKERFREVLVGLRKDGKAPGATGY